MSTIMGRLIRLILTVAHMSYTLNSLKPGYTRDYVGDYYRGYEGEY